MLFRWHTIGILSGYDCNIPPRPNKNIQESPTIGGVVRNVTTHINATAVTDSTGNDVTVYFRSAANRTNVSILGYVWVAISR